MRLEPFEVSGHPEVVQLSEELLLGPEVIIDSAFAYPASRSYVVNRSLIVALFIEALEGSFKDLFFPVFRSSSVSHGKFNILN
jgi:hypothetical protein